MAVEAGHDQLGVVALGGEDVLEDGVGVLGLVEEKVVGVDSRAGQCPDFEVVVVVEAHHAGVGVLEVGPGFAGERQYHVGELGVEGVVFEAAQARYVGAGEVGVGGVAVMGDDAQDGMGQGFVGDVAFTDADVLGDAEVSAGSPAGLAGAVEPAGVAAAGSSEREGLGGKRAAASWAMALLKAM